MKRKPWSICQKKSTYPASFNHEYDLAKKAYRAIKTNLSGE